MQFLWGFPTFSKKTPAWHCNLSLFLQFYSSAAEDKAGIFKNISWMIYVKETFVTVLP